MVPKRTLMRWRPKEFSVVALIFREVQRDRSLAVKIVVWQRLLEGRIAMMGLDNHTATASIARRTGFRPPPDHD